jgi:hypothetical protein
LQRTLSSLTPQPAHLLCSTPFVNGSYLPISPPPIFLRHIFHNTNANNPPRYPKPQHRQSLHLSKSTKSRISFLQRLPTLISKELSFKLSFLASLYIVVLVYAEIGTPTSETPAFTGSGERLLIRHFGEVVCFLSSICALRFSFQHHFFRHMTNLLVEMTRTPLSPLFCIIYRGGSHHLHQYLIQAVLTAPNLISALLPAKTN